VTQYAQKEGQKTALPDCKHSQRPSLAQTHYINGKRARNDDATNEEYRSDRFQRVDHDYGRTTRQLSYSFLRLANLDSIVFERLNRYEATLWRQAVQIIFALQPIKQR